MTTDLAALAGARTAVRIGGDSTNGSDANVRAAIVNSIAVNEGIPVTFGAPNGPRYVDANGAGLTPVGDAPATVTAVGVALTSSRSWRPFLLGIVGMNSWTASVNATAKGGYAAGGPPGNVFPAGIARAFFNTREPCAGPVSTDPADPC